MRVDNWTRSVVADSFVSSLGYGCPCRLSSLSIVIWMTPKGSAKDKSTCIRDSRLSRSLQRIDEHSTLAHEITANRCDDIESLIMAHTGLRGRIWYLDGHGGPALKLSLSARVFISRHRTSSTSSISSVELTRYEVAPSGLRRRYKRMRNLLEKTVIKHAIRQGP
ncbi:hypothetical protein BU23DRAFT_179092 [Bimuria novae-zelandiae CBS 107.79]|uniref:Uncharacterized protein n=1 Tax=Bimuria novae-zelandiae CBS 107.79 TaxID=1447943 RepID=A0A6A5V9H6_9PLEO|nr:hypothetical protein BU23DRAFT_179092 [Bimuria novae-zelandiae CBS 107.79]